jgi:hypothetical protein
LQVNAARIIVALPLKAQSPDEQQSVKRMIPGSRLAPLAVAFCLSTPHFGSSQIASAQAAQASINEARDQLTLDGQVLLDAQKDGFMSLREVRYSPTRRHFLVIACGFECNDNIGFVFKADGGDKRKITARWDYILQSAVEWASDGQKLYYFRINSTGADPPRNAPAEGWVEVDLRTGRKSPATTRVLKTDASYAVINLSGDDVLNIRAKPGRTARIVGSIPRAGRGVKVTGAGVKVGRERWVPISYQNVSGWVNQNYLCEESESPDARRTSPR